MLSGWSKANCPRPPGDVGSLNNQAAILIQSGKSAAALPILDQILARTNLSEARLNRAMARLASQDFAAAETDFRELEQAGTEPALVSYQLATIAEHRHATNQAMRYFRLCLTNTPTRTTLWHQASTLSVVN